MSAVARSEIQVVVGSGPREAARARLGFQMALAAAASGIRVSVFLTAEGTEWGCANGAAGDVDASLVEAVGELMALGASIACCSACAIATCGPSGSAIDRGAETGSTRLRSGIGMVGMVEVLERVAVGVPTLTF